MSIFVLQKSGSIIEAVRQGKIPMQTVLKNGRLVEGIFNYNRAHFSVESGKGAFEGFNLERNFELLRKMCSLGDPQTEHVTSLITSFSLTDEYRIAHDVNVGEGKYKSALFLYWLAEGKDEFTMDDNLRQYVWDYFGHEICGDAMQNPSTKHTTVRYLLNQVGSRVTITRP